MKLLLILYLLICGHGFGKGINVQDTTKASNPPPSQNLRDEEQFGNTKTSDSHRKVVDEFRVQYFTSMEGLPSNEVWSIAEDSLGFLWLGTGNGLVRYDGYTFATFSPQPNDSLSIGGRDIAALHVDARGRLWAGGSAKEPSGLSSFNQEQEKFSRYQHNPDEPNSLVNNAVTSVTSSPADPDVLWIGTVDVTSDTSSGLSRFDVRSGKFTNYRHIQNAQGSISGNRITNVLVGRDGTLWVRTEDGDLNRYNKATDSFEVYLQHSCSGLSGYPINHIYEDREGVLWLGSERCGLQRFDRETGTFSSFFPYPVDHSDKRNVVSAVKEDRAGTIWVGTQNGLYTFDRQSGRFSRFRHQPSTPDINYIYEDRIGVLWIGSYGGGLMKLERWSSPFTIYRNDPNNPNSLVENWVWSIYEDSRDILWISNLRHLNRVNRKEGSVTHYENSSEDTTSMSTGNVVSIFEDRSGILWVSTCGRGGLNRMDLDQPGRFSRFQHRSNDPTSIGGECVNPVLEDRAGNFWISLWGNGIDRMDRSQGTFTHFNQYSHGLGDNRVLRLYETPSEPGTLWVGTEQGLSRFDTKSETFTNFHDENLSRTMMMHEDRSGRFWVATASSGLHLFDRKTGTSLQLYTTKDGLAHNIIWSILEDDQGFLWLSTSGGLSKFDPERRTFRNYYIRDGLPGNYFNEHAHHKSNSGELFFGGPGGAVSFFPDQVEDSSSPPIVVLTGFQIAGQAIEIGQDSPLQKSIMLTEAITLSHQQKDLTIEYVGLRSKDPSQNRYRYKLEGYDEEWVEAGVQRSARYPRLPPGTYTFHVKASNSSGQWYEEETTMGITILPPWWLTWWAYLFYGLLLISAAVAIGRIQKRRIVRKEREKIKQRELEHAREIERAYRQLKQTQAQLIQQEKLASLGQLTAGIAHEIKNPLNFVNNFAVSSSELAEEIKMAVENGNLEEIRAIATDLKLTTTKIEEHGKRVDGIVKSMLLHARGSTGEKQHVDVNVMLDESVALAYHSFRAQVPDFDCTIEKEYDPSIGLTEMIPQEMGRVFLNLLNNAFFAVHEKATRFSGQYAPKVSVTTRRIGEMIEIRIEDNGQGIAGTIKEKVFEPFFTTKPTGQGTGLGLSLAYDIVTKGHGGTLELESIEGSGASFIVTFPSIYQAASDNAFGTVRLSSTQ